MAPEKAQEEAQVEALIALKTAFLNNRTQNDGRKHRRVGLGPICFGAAAKKTFSDAQNGAIDPQTSGDGLSASLLPQSSWLTGENNG